MKNIKKILNDELDNGIREISEELKSYPITKREANSNNKFLYYFNRLHGGYILAGLALICVIIGLTFGLMPRTSIKTSYYVLEINPTVMLEADTNNRVSKAKSGNDDADTLLYGMNLEGVEINEAIENLTREAIRQGYIDKDREAPINISGVNTTKDMLKEIKDTLTDSLLTLDFNINVSSDFIDLLEFNNKYNINIDNFESYFDTIMDFNYETRLLKADADFSLIYINEYLSSYLFDTLNNHLNELEEVKRVIDSINSQYYIIKNLKTGSLINDYWYLITAYYKNKEIPTDIKKELDKMNELLLEYEEIRGVKINSQLEMTIESGKLELLNIELLRELTNDIKNLISFIIEGAEEAINYVKSILDLIIPELSSAISDLCSIPSEVDDYYTKVNKIIGLKREERINKANALID